MRRTAIRAVAACASIAVVSALAVCVLVAAARPSAAQDHSREEVREFLNNFVPSACVIHPPDYPRPFGASGWRRRDCSFSIDRAGRMRIETTSHGRETFVNTYEAMLADLNPSGVEIFHMRGGRFWRLRLTCTNRRKCATYELLRSGGPSKSDIFDLDIQRKDDADRLSKAFPAAIRAFGGKRDPF